MDVRIIAAMLVVLGIVFGFVPFYWLLGISVGLVVYFGWVLRRENRIAPGGTSGAMGLTLMVVGGLICFLIPAWITYVIR